VAVIGLVTGGATAGAGYAPTRALLEGQAELPGVYTLLKFCATWLSAWTGVPAGVFAPSLAIGAGIGHDVALLAGLGREAAIPLIALGMVGFLAATTQGPITAFIIVMEMVSGHAMVLSLMACALLASGVARLVTRPMYRAGRAAVTVVAASRTTAAPRSSISRGRSEGVSGSEGGVGPGAAVVRQRDTSVVTATAASRPLRFHHIQNSWAQAVAQHEVQGQPCRHAGQHAGPRGAAVEDAAGEGGQQRAVEQGADAVDALHHAGGQSPTHRPTPRSSRPPGQGDSRAPKAAARRATSRPAGRRSRAAWRPTGC
jgi:hypothetical protein